MPGKKAPWNGIERILNNIRGSFAQQRLIGQVDKQEVLGKVQKGVSSKAAGPSTRGSYTPVREHDEGPRTQLVPFFNIPIKIGL